MGCNPISRSCHRHSPTPQLFSSDSSHSLLWCPGLQYQRQRGEHISMTVNNVYCPDRKPFQIPASSSSITKNWSTASSSGSEEVDTVSMGRSQASYRKSIFCCHTHHLVFHPLIKCALLPNTPLDRSEGCSLSVEGRSSQDLASYVTLFLSLCVDLYCHTTATKDHSVHSASSLAPRSIGSHHTIPTYHALRWQSLSIASRPL